MQNAPTSRLSGRRAIPAEASREGRGVVAERERTCLIAEGETGLCEQRHGVTFCPSVAALTSEGKRRVGIVGGALECCTFLLRSERDVSVRALEPDTGAECQCVGLGEAEPTRGGKAKGLIAGAQGLAPVSQATL